LDSGSTPDTSTHIAALAQLVEQLICNQQVVGSTLTGGSNGEIMTTEELLWILIGINSVSFLYFNWRLALHSTVVKNMVKEQPNLKDKPKRK
jgi:hypothetical protein